MSLPLGINEPLPFEDPIADRETGYVTDVWSNYMERTWLPQTRAATIKTSRYASGATPLQDALAITVLEAQIPSDGLAIFFAALSIQAPAGVASNLELVLSWTWRGLARSETFGPIVDGTTADQLGIAFPFLADGGSPVSIQTNYTSNPANDLEYDLQASVNLNGLPQVGTT